MAFTQTGQKLFDDIESFDKEMKKDKLSKNHARLERMNAIPTGKNTRRRSKASTDEDEEAREDTRRYLSNTKIFIKMPSTVRRQILKSLDISHTYHQNEDEDTSHVQESREHVGCDCPEGECLPETCSCILNGIKCYLDSYDGLSCGCVKDCPNPHGTISYNNDAVQWHYEYIKLREQLLNDKEVKGGNISEVNQKLEDLELTNVLNIEKYRAGTSTQIVVESDDDIGFGDEVNACDFLDDSGNFIDTSFSNLNSEDMSWTDASEDDLMAEMPSLITTPNLTC
uniref:CSRNP_N domain-containing protein n=1 Tax=Rhabditophanes sp. KR3021 TaxID=114890 RepID=A0AC35U3V6_9BILA